MMRLWTTSYARHDRRGSAGALSIIAHVAIIGAWIAGTLPVESLPSDSFANRIYYIPPPDRPPLARGQGETIRYLTLAPGPGVGPGISDVDPSRPMTPPVAERSRVAGEQRADSTPSTPSPVAGSPTGDSIFTILEVDTAVVRSASSAAPAYPVELLEKKIQGMVLARYVVDTTGFADTSSFEVIRATHPGFVQAVRDALPYMRFSPAKIGSLRVRQLVEQPFTFRIDPGMVAGPKPR